MANVTDLFKGQKINKLKTGAITAHVNNLIKTDADFKAKFQSDPVGVLSQFGLSRKESASLILSTINNEQKLGLAGITDCCCTASITGSCGCDANSNFWKALPSINDTKAWSKLAGK